MILNKTKKSVNKKRWQDFLAVFLFIEEKLKFLLYGLKYEPI